MKAAIIYYSKTGHSRKIANAIATELQIQALDIKTDPKLSNLDLLFIIGGIYADKSDPAMIAYIKRLESNKIKKVALITSCASNKTKQDVVRETLLRNNIEVLPEEFICKGSFLFMGIGHPNVVDINNAVSYAKNIANIEK